MLSCFHERSGIVCLNNSDRMAIWWKLSDVLEDRPRTFGRCRRCLSVDARGWAFAADAELEDEEGRWAAADSMSICGGVLSVLCIPDGGMA
jgi:hypothetical protein